ncbi:uncharacterized protein LOC121861102 [Homarus americanus]|uniref:uncharacterized protein LOC121861102 n=1 Tax=Homarus americanus TaxID=6706 RepID=UPI001C44E3FC|nr:uncharacterized protein LOC121861102 [Homarus americanus]
MSGMDRHKGVRRFENGNAKRKSSKERAEREAKEFTKTRRLTEFFTRPSASEHLVSASASSSSRQPEQVPACDASASSLYGSSSLSTGGNDQTAEEIEIESKHVPPEVQMATTQNYDIDISLWSEHLTKQFIDYWAANGSEHLHHKCTPAMFERRNRNGEVVKRSWLCFFPTNGRVYCFFCKLMGVSRSQFTSDGFCDWKHTNRLVAHEQSKDHIQAVLSAASRAKGAGELLAEYVDFLGQHIQNHANRGTGHTNYISSTICEEIVRLMGNEVLNEIISRIKLSKYYKMSLDSIPDEGHIDELTLIIRYMEHDTPVERFVKFLSNQGHKAQEMFEGLMKFLADNDIDIQNCPG